MEAAAVPAASIGAAKADVRYRELQERPRGWVRWGLFCTYAVVLLGFSHSSFTFNLGIVIGCAWLLLGREVLVTEVSDGALHVSFRRGMSKSVPLSSIRGAEIVSYYAVVDSGFGVRNGRAVRVRLDGPDSLVIGSARPDELLAALRGPTP